MKNLYKILNIAELEQALISAGYNKSKTELLKKKNSFESEHAFNARMQEIEEAYQILSTKRLKMEHDFALLQEQLGRTSTTNLNPGPKSGNTNLGPNLGANFSAKDSTHLNANPELHPSTKPIPSSPLLSASGQPQELSRTLSPSPSPSPSQSPTPLLIERDWELASEHFPLILQEYDRLLKFDDQLAKTYQTQLHSKANYKDSTALKNKLEKEYFFGIYGNNLPAKAYAKKLLLSNWKEAANKFNASLRLLGHVVSIADLILQIEKEFEFIKDTHGHTEFLNQLKKDKCSTKSCIAFIEDFFHIEVQTHRFIFDQTFSFKIEDEEFYLHHTDDLKGFIKTQFLNYKKRDVPDNPFIMGR